MIQFDQKKIRFALIMGNAVLTKAIIILVFGWGGNKLDQKWGTSPLMMMVGLVLGLSLGIWYIFILANRMGKNRPPE